MTKFSLGVFLLVFFCSAYGQRYTVTHINGKVYHKNKILKLKDRLNGADSLWSDNVNAEVGLLSLTKGRVLVRFDNGRPTREKLGNKHSELFYLTVQEYIKDYTASKILTHRGNFDFVDFFEDTTGVGSPIPILIVPKQEIPLISQERKILDSDELYLCTVTINDTVCIKAQIINHSLFLPISLDAVQKYSSNQTFLLHKYLLLDTYVERYSPYPLRLNIVSEAILKNIVCAFASNLSGFYKEDKKRMKEDIYAELSYLYGHFYPGTIEKIISSPCP